ncbi:fungal-specific transcription factor domain-containing protein [Boletus reticuloceps]|uniref:Fungal-specific transcription factor domain-containing protein n=1 Tax=Boletus reticuloceps TaxID=495285 RepID=A0A8I2YWZ3_9AGAM|nr:fungal-specific transcription factor domain-containing protein [Boletus reticuloceps]
MPDDANPNADPSSSSPSVQRQKQHRAATTSSSVRSRTSPPPGEHDPRPPTKRARKAINCEPCRNSKLKCDRYVPPPSRPSSPVTFYRNRPCSSCVLRGTIALCYQDAKGHESDLHLRDDHNASRVDPMQEITRLKHSVSLLETYILANHRHTTPLKHPLDNPTFHIPKKEPVDSDILEKDNVPGMLGSHGHGGFYTGATSAVTHLTLNSRQSDDTDRQPSPLDDIATTNEYDRDLLALLPPLETIDGLVSYYFEYCNWIYRHINQPAFLSAWSRYKTGANADRIVLATVCMTMAIAVHYLPPGDPLVAQLGDTLEDVCHKFYDVMRSALDRHRAEHKTYSLELVESLLIRCHYLTLVKTDSEEIWAVRGELISIGMAMGLHRDPCKWRMSKELAERRRWAWWHIILLERWQAFMFGRPISIASHHFDTQFPDPSDPVHHPDEPRIYGPNLHLFRLAYILGDIMDSAVSMRPVAYETVQAHDRALAQWMDTLPSELDLDEFRVARSLASPHTVTRRLGVQSVIIRTSFYHIRFTLHRPYASAPSPKASDKQSSSSKDKDKHVRHVMSLDIAVNAADKLITLVGQARPDFLANASLAVPGHMNWGPFHVFSSAMFFSFQLISNPDQPGASLFRANIQKALTALELSRGTAVADKALDILHALAPLYSQDFVNEPEQERERIKSRVLSLVKTLAFPYHDSPKYPRVNAVDSPNAPGYISSPATGNSGSPQGGSAQPRGSVDYGNGSSKTANNSSSSLVGYSSVQTSPVQSMSTQGIVAGPSSSSPLAYPSQPPKSQSQLYSDAPRASYTVEPARHAYGDTARPPGTVSGNPYPDTRPTASYSEPYPPSRSSYPDPTSSRSFVDPTRQPYPDPSRQPYMSGDAALGRYPYSYPTATDEETMWGASLSQAEWARFLDVMQHPRHTGDRH